MEKVNKGEIYIPNTPVARMYIGVYVDVVFIKDPYQGCYGYDYNFLGRYFGDEKRLKNIKNHLVEVEFFTHREQSILIGEFDPEMPFCFNDEVYSINWERGKRGVFKTTTKVVAEYTSNFLEYYKDILSFIKPNIQKMEVNFGTLIYYGLTKYSMFKNI